MTMDQWNTYWRAQTDADFVDSMIDSQSYLDAYNMYVAQAGATDPLPFVQMIFDGYALS